ncbi:MAG: hypothetical protein ACRDFZ_08995, partial [Candidatus Limnocylindria bacterium]
MRAAFAVALTGLSLLLSVAPALASDVVPITILGNPTCASVGLYTHEFKVEPVTSGLHGDPGSDFEVQLTVQSNGLGQTVDIAGNVPVDAVIVKGGPNANVYVYVPPVLTDDALHAPINLPGGSYFGLGHVRFCFAVVPTASASPTPSPTPTPTPTPSPTPT